VQNEQALMPDARLQRTRDAYDRSPTLADLVNTLPRRLAPACPSCRTYEECRPFKTQCRALIDPGFGFTANVIEGDHT